MGSELGADTSTTAPGTERRRSPLWQSLSASAVFVIRPFVAADISSFRERRVLELTSGTQIVNGTPAESSTQLSEMTAEAKARLEALLEDARYDFIEDGMRNVVTERLPELVSKNYSTVIPSLVSAIETGRATESVAAELLKELGQIRNAASHPIRLWTLEHSLNSRSPVIRDGAGLGLARLGDPHALPYLQRAVEIEPDTQIREYLKLVVRELAETIPDGAPVTKSH